MSRITQHFDSDEFRCNCCGKVKYDSEFIKRLENLYELMKAKKIIITSGYRCPNHSVRVGGYKNDTHTLGFAADVVVYKQDGNPYTSLTVAHYAEKIGFGGIGIIDRTAVHLDSRDVNSFVNNHWYGNEITGENYTTFKDVEIEEIQDVKNEEKKKRIELYVDGVKELDLYV